MIEASTVDSSTENFHADEATGSTAPIYLDCAATAPIEPKVLAEMNRIWMEEPGNAGSRTHEYGLRAKKLVQNAREQVAALASVQPEELVFTSGATESNNIAILGLAHHGKRTGRCHVVSTAIEHKAVLDPLQSLRRNGFEVTLVPPGASGAVVAEDVAAVVRKDTFLISVMQVNNETGIRQPIESIAELLRNHEAWFHVDAAQGFGKDLEPLRNTRIDLMSVSSHKMSGPVGVGALITRRRQFVKPPLQPIMFGGGQERGLRHGTLPTALIAGMGLAAELAERQHLARRDRCLELRKQLLDALSAQSRIEVTQIGDQSLAMPNILNLAVTDIDAEALILALKDLIAVSNGSACTSHSYEPSHVLKAMGLPESVISSSVRFSWCHLTPSIDWSKVVGRIATLV